MSSSSSSTNHCCSHLLSHVTNPTSTSLRSLSRCLNPLPLGRFEILRDPQELPHCSLCPATSPRLFACLFCATITCPTHSHSHSQDHSHQIAVDINRAELFCFSCHDQIYHPDFDAAAVLAADKQLLCNDSRSLIVRIPGKRKRKMDLDETKIVITEQEDDDDELVYPRGLRGMNNLGNTCFMSSVLQALMHTVPMRNYFLSDLHNRFVCQQMSRKKRNDGTGRVLCLACDLDHIYSHVFSGDRTPYSPANFLYSWWQHALNLASYEQQDAHEFFISILDGIHEKLMGDQSKPQTQSNGNCCIAHRVFSGTLRSDVICTICGFTSTTYDPCVDISLDLNFTAQNSAKGPPSKLSNQNCSISTLMGCLERFTRPERLCSDQKFFCQHCQSRQDSLKQMSIKKLPLVTCFHIKRFEHSAIRKMSRKIDRYLQFPFFLNMSPYLSSSILRNRYGNRIFSTDADDRDELASEFELFAMITHSGKLDGGHYITYLRLNNQWYKCDDAWVIHVSESIVRASQAYMLFYVQKMLFYKAGENAVSS